MIENLVTNSPWKSQLCIATPRWLLTVEPFTVDEVLVSPKKIPPKKPPGADDVIHECTKKNISKYAPVISFSTCVNDSNAYQLNGNIALSH